MSTGFLVTLMQFAAVKYTKKSTFMLNEDSETKIIKGFMAVGLT